MKRFTKWVIVPILLIGASVMTVSGCKAAERAFVGLQVQGMSAEMAQALGWSEPMGVLIRDVAHGGPGALAGLMQGDIIVRLADKDVHGFKALVGMVRDLEPAQNVPVTVVRQGAKRDMVLVPSEWPEAWSNPKNSFSKLPVLGLTLAGMTAKVREQFGLRWGATGVVVTLFDTAKADELIGRMDLRRGEVIVQVNQTPVWKPSQIVKAYREAKSAGRKHLLLLVEGWEGARNGYRYSLLPVD